MTLQNLETAFVRTDFQNGTAPKILSVKSAQEKKLMDLVNVSGVGKVVTVVKLLVMLTIVTDADLVSPNKKTTLQNLEIVYVILVLLNGTVYLSLCVKSVKERKLMDPANASGVGKVETVVKLPVMLTIVTDVDLV
jgi:hypothetical protein